MSSVPHRDMREVYLEFFEPGVDSNPDMRLPDNLYDDMRYINDSDVMGFVPWTFDEVPLKQRVMCKVGWHRGRCEVLAGEVCFYCSYCGYHTF